jgi:hypothetical protein
MAEPAAAYVAALVAAQPAAPTALAELVAAVKRPTLGPALAAAVPTVVGQEGMVQVSTPALLEVNQVRTARPAVLVALQVPRLA